VRSESSEKDCPTEGEAAGPWEKSLDAVIPSSSGYDKPSRRKGPFLVAVNYLFERLITRIVEHAHRSVPLAKSLATFGEQELRQRTARDYSSPLRPPEPAYPRSNVLAAAIQQYTKTAPAADLCIVDVSHHRSVAVLSCPRSTSHPYSLSCGRYVNFPHTLRYVAWFPDLSLRSERLSPNPRLPLRLASALHWLHRRWMADRHEV
jgi:hypothetical protein